MLDNINKTFIAIIALTIAISFSGEVKSEPENESQSAGITIVDFNFGNKSVTNNGTKFFPTKKSFELDPEANDFVQRSIAVNYQASLVEVDTLEYQKTIDQRVINNILQNEYEFVYHNGLSAETIANNIDPSIDELSHDDNIPYTSTVANVPGDSNEGLN